MPLTEKQKRRFRMIPEPGETGEAEDQNAGHRPFWASVMLKTVSGESDLAVIALESRDRFLAEDACRRIEEASQRLGSGVPSVFTNIAARARTKAARIYAHQKLGHHDWDNCQCRVCGEWRHEWEYVSSVDEYVSAGPTGFDYDIITTTKERCRHCGKERELSFKV